MKKQIGNRVKVFNCDSAESLEKEINEFLSTFKMKDENGDYLSLPYILPLGNVGYKAIVQYPIFSE